MRISLRLGDEVASGNEESWPKNGFDKAENAGPKKNGGLMEVVDNFLHGVRSTK
jgi:hypothetical protein